MRDSSTISGEIDTSKLFDSAVRLPMRKVDETQLARPRAWPRATRELTNEIPRPLEAERMRGMIWCAVGGLLTVLGIYLVF